METTNGDRAKQLRAAARMVVGVRRELDPTVEAAARTTLNNIKKTLRYLATHLETGGLTVRTKRGRT